MICRYCRNEDGDCPHCYTPRPQGPIAWTVGATFQSVHAAPPGWAMSVDDAGSIDVQRADDANATLARDRTGIGGGHD